MEILNIEDVRGALLIINSDNDMLNIKAIKNGVECVISLDALSIGDIRDELKHFVSFGPHETYKIRTKVIHGVEHNSFIVVNQVHHEGVRVSTNKRSLTVDGAMMISFSHPSDDTCMVVALNIELGKKILHAIENVYYDIRENWKKDVERYIKSN